MKSREQLELLADSLARAWNAHDALALCAFCAADADLVDERGAIVQGRDAIFARCEAWFAAVFAQSSLAIHPVKVRALGSRAALLHAIWSLRGHAVHRPDWLPVLTGTLLLVCRRSGERWELVLVHCGGTPALTES